MHPRAARLIAALALEPHPEGGHFRQVHRSAHVVDPMDGRAERTALTLIYFLLAGGAVSRWHRVGSDEAWCFLEGDALELVEAGAGFERIAVTRLGRFADGIEPAHVVPAGSWQAARCTGEFTLVCCAVGPGFDYADFEMLNDVPAELEALRLTQPDRMGLV